MTYGDKLNLKELIKKVGSVLGLQKLLHTMPGGNTVQPEASSGPAAMMIENKENTTHTKHTPAMLMVLRFGPTACSAADIYLVFVFPKRS